MKERGISLEYDRRKKSERSKLKEERNLNDYQLRCKKMEVSQKLER
jgi:hypothetical protein